MDKIISQLQSLLFIAAKPLPLKQLAELTEATEEEIATALDKLLTDLQEAQGGWQVIKTGHNYQMVSSPDNADVVQKFRQAETSGELSKASLETLTIIAYRGPIAKLELDQIRGVNCTLILRNLSLHGLIETVPGAKAHDTCYQVTCDFLKFLGVNEPAQLPDYERLHQAQEIEQLLTEEK